MFYLYVKISQELAVRRKEKKSLLSPEKGNTFLPDKVITIGHNYSTQNNKVMIEFPLAWRKTLELTEVIKKRRNLIPISMITNGSGKG